MKTYDITIVGGGLVGTLLAIALKESPWRVALIESFAPNQHQQATEDMRSIALSECSRNILESYAIWQDVEKYATPIEKIHVSEQKRFGKTVLDAKKLDLPDFAQVVPIPYLYQALQNNLEKNNKNITLFRPANVTEIKKEKNKDALWTLKINDQEITTKLVIAADGERSFIRESLKLSIEKKEYQQTAIVTTALVSKSHANMAYERFTAQGVLAILPLQNNRVAVIWTVPNEYIEKISQNLLSETQKAMGYRLGKFSTIGKIQQHALKEMHADIKTLPGLFLLGNAQHILHPVAAQGFNLSVRDVAVLAGLLYKTSDVNSEDIFKLYHDLRKDDQAQTERFTSNVIKLFSVQFLPISILRSIGLLAFDLMPAVKRDFCLKRMGMI